MVALLSISSALFLGWALGANRAANIFGVALASRAVRTGFIVVVAGVFIALGAVLQGAGTSQALANLGGVNTLGGAFTVMLGAAAAIVALKYYGFPASIGQAVVGAIVSWCFFSSTPVDIEVFRSIVIMWIASPIVGGLLGASIYLLIRWCANRSKVHVIKLDLYTRFAIILAGMACAYALGANNVANVVGVFFNLFPVASLNQGFIPISSQMALLLAGGVAIAAGVLSSSRGKWATATGIDMASLTPEATIAVVLAQAIVLLAFSMGIVLPMLPVSSTLLAYGAIIGVGLVRGAQELKLERIGKFALGWAITPLIAGLITFLLLFIMQNVFDMSVFIEAKGDIAGESQPGISGFGFNTMLHFVVVVLLMLLVVVAAYVVFRVKSKRGEAVGQEARWRKEVQYADLKKAISDIEVKNIQIVNDNLAARLEEKRRELVTYALNIGEQWTFLEGVSAIIEEARAAHNIQDKDRLLLDALNVIKQKMSFVDETESIYLRAEQVSNDFPARLASAFPHLTEQERRLTVLLRIGLSTKEIAPILNISPKSVEISRYRLRKRLGLAKDDNLTKFIKSV